jgi:predicted short-subunit dehydrogenase-like oxidoreductase (DUF2520 family)
LLTDATRPRIGFIGAGRTAFALSRALTDAGYEVSAVSSRAPTSSAELAALLPNCAAFEHPQGVIDSAGLIFITTPDDAIRATADELFWRHGIAVVHCSGALSRDVLAAAAANGVETGCLHPLQTFASRDTSPDLHGTWFAIEADAPLKATLRELVEALGGVPITLRAADRALYHASAVLASNYVVTLLKLATDLWLRFGYDRTTALEALLPLLRGAAGNLEMLGLPAALTGPVARGDVASVRKHIEALADGAPEVLDAYRVLGMETLPVALAKGGLGEETAMALRALFTASNSFVSTPGGS